MLGVYTGPGAKAHRPETIGARERALEPEVWLKLLILLPASCVI